MLHIRIQYYLILLTISDKSVPRVKIEMRCVSHGQFRFIGFGHPSLNIQSCIRRPLCSTFKFKSLHRPKKTVFQFFGGQKEFKNFLIKKVLCIFLVQTLWYFHEKHEKNPPSKVGQNRSQLYFQYWHGCPNCPKTEIPYSQKPLNAGLSI